MSTTAAILILSLAGAYALVGVLVAATFAFRGVQRLDPAAVGTGWGFRLIIIPAATALWPIVLRRWCSAPRASAAPTPAPPPDTRDAPQRTAHLIAWCTLAPVGVVIIAVGALLVPRAPAPVNLPSDANISAQAPASTPSAERAK